MARAILSVIAGYIVWTVIWLAGGAALAAAFPDQPTEQGVYDSAALLAITLVLSLLCSIVAGLTCGRIARGRPVPPIVLGVLLLLTGIGVQASVWSIMPIWYHIPFLILLLPVTLVGARLAGSKK